MVGFWCWPNLTCVVCSSLVYCRTGVSKPRPGTWCSPWQASFQPMASLWTPLSSFLNSHSRFSTRFPSTSDDKTKEKMWHMEQKIERLRCFCSRPLLSLRKNKSWAEGGQPSITCINLSPKVVVFLFLISYQWYFTPPLNLLLLLLFLNFLWNYSSGEEFFWVIENKEDTTVETGWCSNSGVGLEDPQPWCFLGDLEPTVLSQPHLPSFCFMDKRRVSVNLYFRLLLA